MTASIDTNARAATTPSGRTFTIPPMRRILDEDGRLVDGAQPPLADEHIRKLYEHMLRARLLDARMLKLQRQGRIGTFAPSFGQEAAQVGCMAALTPQDWFVPSFREMAAALYRGATPKAILLYAMGFEEGSVVPEGARDLPVSIPVGGQSAHGMGLAWAMKLRKDPGIAVSFFGDGATSEGIVHESMNFAGVLEVGCIFFCQNNQWAISTPRSIQTASPTIAQKAIAHGIHGVQVDGNDVLAVYEVTLEAAKRARENNEATLIEAITFRRGVHTTADDPRVYRSKEEEDAWVSRDPIDRVYTYLKAKGAWSDADQEALEQRINDEIESDLREAEAFRDTNPDPLAMFDHVYEVMPPYIARQREEAKAAFEGRLVIRGKGKAKVGTGSTAVVGELEIAED